MPFLQAVATMGLLHLFIKLFFGFLILSFFARMILSWLVMAIPTLNPANPTTARNSAVFGVIQSDINASTGTQGDYRVVQIAAKFVF